MAESAKRAMMEQRKAVFMVLNHSAAFLNAIALGEQLAKLR
jgi:hypothetical protein